MNWSLLDKWSMALDLFWIGFCGSTDKMCSSLLLMEANVESGISANSQTEGWKRKRKIRQMKSHLQPSSPGGDVALDRLTSARPPGSTKPSKYIKAGFSQTSIQKPEFEKHSDASTPPPGLSSIETFATAARKLGECAATRLPVAHVCAGWTRWFPPTLSPSSWKWDLSSLKKWVYRMINAFPSKFKHVLS